MMSAPNVPGPADIDQRGTTARRGYIRSVEAIIAIVLLLASIQGFINWGSLKTQSTQSIRQSAYDVLAVREGAHGIALYDTALYDGFISAAVPSNMNYRIEADYFSPLDTFFGYNDTGYPHEITVDLPPGAGPVSVTGADGAQVPSQTVFNWYRVQFFLKTREAGFDNQNVVLGFTLPYADFNGDGTLDVPDKNSLDLYINGTRRSFTLQDFTDTGVLSKAVVSFRYTMNPDTYVDGYAYYMVGGRVEAKNGR